MTTAEYLTPQGDLGEDPRDRKEFLATVAMLRTEEQQAAREAAEQLEADRVHFVGELAVD